MSHSPNLTEEELVLTLQAYFEIGPENISDDHPKVRRLSRVLRQLPIHAPEDRPSDEAFRPPEGLRGRLNEFRRIEEGTNRRKLHAYRKVWNRYKNDPDGLRKAADTILRKYGVVQPGKSAYPTKIEYNKQPSSFYPACQEAIEQHWRGGDSRAPITVEFDRGGGYDGDVRVEIDPDRRDAFATDWTGSDSTRFPARIKAAATALRDHTSGGRFRVQHEGGHLAITPLGSRGTVSSRADATEVSSAIRKERTLREEMWEELVNRGGPSGVPSSLLREIGMYKGQAGIWADKERTSSLTADNQGITIGLLHTGSAYADDLDAKGVLYHYPDTDRPGSRDQNEVEATKNAGRYGVPLFIITYLEPDATERDVHWGRVKDWDDDARIFFVEFGEGPDSQSIMPLGVHDHDESFQLTDTTDAGTTRQNARPGQSRFAFKVFKRYGLQCAICDVEVKAMLEACHIRGKEHRGSDHSGNGLVLCANHHRAFDADLFAIAPETLAVEVEPEHSAEELRIMRSSLNHLPRPPHPKAIRWRWKRWGGT